VLAKGAGAEVRHAMGVTVFAGMIGVTCFGLLLTPVFFVLLRKLTHRRLAGALPETNEKSAEAAIGFNPEVHGA
jgi:gold/copper resistance efflux pump